MIKKYMLMFVSLILLVALMPSVSAFEFDNVKSYDPVSREATFSNSILGIPTTQIGKARLNTPLNVKVGLGYQKVAEFDIWAYGDYNDAIKQFTFTDEKKKEKINRDYDLKYLTYEEVKVNDYKEVCNIDLKSLNDTKVCNNIKVGSHYETKAVWNKVTPADLKKNERLTIGIFTEVKEGDFVDWIPTIYGVEVKEWATWTADLNTDIINYYKLDETSGTTADDAVENGDGTNDGATVNQAGKIGKAYNFEISNTDYIHIPDNTDYTNLGELTLSMWVKPTSLASPYMHTIAKDSNSGGRSFYVEILTDGKIKASAWDENDNEEVVTSSNALISTGTWYHIVTIIDVPNDDIKIYVDGDNKGLADSPTWAGSVIKDSSTTLDIGRRAYSGSEQYYDGLIDEVGIWGRALTSEEVTQLYNSGTGITYTDVFNTAPTITLNSPASTNATTIQSFNVNLTAYDDIQLSDVKLYVNDILNQTNATGVNNSNYIFPLSLSDGNYTIKGIATDNNSATANSSSIDFLIDTIKPIINITAPVTETITTTLPVNITLLSNATDLNLNSCWYHDSYNATNTTYTCNTATNISFTSAGTKVIYVFVNDTLGNVNDTSTSFLINYIQENATYETTIVEGDTATVVLNITATELSTFNGTLHYNGTDYTPTISTGSVTGLLTYSIATPPVEANELIYFNWTYNLNGIEYDSSNYNQTILYLTPINITSASCVHKALRFDLQDEINLSAVTGDIKYNFKFGTSNSSYKEVYGSLTGVTNFYVCVNATVSENYTIGYGEIQYTSSGYVDRRYYLFEDKVISNNTLNNITLRDLDTTLQTSFLITMEDTSLATYPNKYTALWRWYPDLNEYQIVEMGKTDEQGQTVSHVDTEDVDYRVGLYNLDGTLIKLGDPIRFICTSAPCSFTLRVGASTVDYTSIFDIQTEITYNETTGMFVLVYNDPNQYTSSMRFYVTRETGSDTLVICNDTSSGFTGVMSCNTSMYNGYKKAVAFRSASPPVVIAQKIVDIRNTTFNSTFGLFISMFLWLAIVLSGFGNNPLWTIILGIVGLIPALLIGSINITIFTGIAVLGAIIIHFIKRTVAR